MDRQPYLFGSFLFLFLFTLYQDQKYLFRIRTNAASVQVCLTWGSFDLVRWHHSSGGWSRGRGRGYLNLGFKGLANFFRSKVTRFFSTMILFPIKLHRSHFLNFTYIWLIHIWIGFNSRDSYWNRLIAIDRSEFNELAIK